MKEHPFILVIIVLGIFLISLSGYYYRENFTTDSVIQGITETVRASAVSNMDNSSRIQSGELYLSKDEFEKDFKKRIGSNKLVKISNDAKYRFDYLDNKNGSVKAIKTIIQDGKNTYQATYKVSIATS
ncbi:MULTISPECIES: hypothetical protein [Bacillus cereus group]|uniref:Uncharacterized protein n=1 Tax=Bacillus thuringiensis TaxID=1428 RepID=A0A9X6Z1P9_BACTU|nr:MULTISPECIES: hypothetical protein [Bacillus cereus group]MCU5280041.1 hypothetical protein [Bacillus cereus]MEB4843037.1 hypothetical protein [Paenibacillus jamilae]KIP23597.1 hypothetical protein BG10_1765 [Bacillus thuringiensis serovar morrisoni]MBG9638237.1 hypothetical protein [Bacillus thuringiensis]MBG9674457.1 hypothetical protein [Bacillus thuringiensis]